MCCSKYIPLGNILKGPCPHVTFCRVVLEKCCYGYAGFHTYVLTYLMASHAKQLHLYVYSIAVLDAV